jgi:transposase
LVSFKTGCDTYPKRTRLLAVLHRWRGEAVRAGRTITRIALAFEAGRDGFWLARWLAARGVEAHVIHPSSVAVSREHRRAKTDRLDTELLKRGSWGGYAANGAIAAWCAYRRLPKRTPSGPIGSASAWSGNARGLSIA